MEAGAETLKATAKPRTKGRFVLASGILLLAVVIALVIHFGEGRQFAELLKRARPGWLAVALGLQAATYICAAGVWHRALARQGRRRPLGQLVALGLAKVFMDQAVPSAGVSGTMLVARALRRRGLSHRDALATVLAGLIAYYISYGIAVLTSLVLLWSTGRVSRLVTTAATAFAVIVVAVPSGILWMTRRAGRLPAWIRRFGPLKKFLTALGDRPAPVLRNRKFLLEATVLQLGIILFDAATLWVLLYGIGVNALPQGVFCAFTVASVVATVSPIPSGLGTFDGTMIAMLRAFGVPLEPALAATVLFRGYTLLLPLVPGFWIARREAVKR
jgi:uncharacterized protein (TIRG00374 family)